jgi:transcriptional regulator with XRE-family HTH domain
VRIQLVIKSQTSRRCWGEAFRISRLACKMTQAELAVATHLSTAQIRHLEGAGTLDIEVIDTLCKYYERHGIKIEM